MNIAAIRNAFKDKKLRYGGYATLLTAVVVALVLILNVLMAQIPAVLDMTRRGLFTLSEQTYDLLDKLEAEVTVYGFFQTGRENPSLTQVLDKYDAGSRKLNVEYVDPVRNPGFARKFEKDGKSVGESSLVVSSGSRFKVISQFELYNVYTNQQTQTQQVQAQSFERQITSGILYVTSDDLPVLGALTYHDETLLPYEIRRQMELENFTIQDVDLVTQEAVSEDVDILLINGPQRDISVDEAERLRAYLDGGGSAIIHVGLVQEDFGNLNSVLEPYGVAIRNALVVEDDPRRHMPQMPIFLIPEMSVHDIVYPLRTQDMFVFMPVCRYIELLELKKRTTTVEAILTTSEDAYAKADIESAVPFFEEGDHTGPFEIAVAITDRLDDGGENSTKIVLIANADFLDSDLITGYPANADLFLNSLSWMHDREDNLTIRPKSLLAFRLDLTAFQSLLFSGIVVILVPLIVFGIGLTVWLRRRHL